MYKIVIGGKTVEELKKNLAALNAGLNAVTEISVTTDEEEDEEEFREAPANYEPVIGPAAPAPGASLPEIPTRVTRPAELAVAAEPQKVPAFDSRGLPWDARVHSASKALKGDGSWRVRRGIDDDTLRAVEATLPRNGVAAPVQAPIPAPIPAPVQAPQQVIPVQHVQTVAAIPQVHEQKYESIPIPTMHKPAHDLASFRAQLIPTLSKLVDQGKLTQEYLNQLKAYFKVDEIWNLNDAQLAEMLEQFSQAGLVTKVR